MSKHWRKGDAEGENEKMFNNFFFIYFNNNSSNNNNYYSGNKNTSTKLPRESTAFPAVKTIP